MIKKEDFKELLKNPLFKKLIDNFEHQEKEITIIKRELTKIQNTLNGDFNKTLENTINNKIEDFIKRLENKPTFKSPLN